MDPQQDENANGSKHNETLVHPRQFSDQEIKQFEKKKAKKSLEKGTKQPNFSNPTPNGQSDQKSVSSITQEDRNVAIQRLKEAVEGVRHFRLSKYDALQAAKIIEEQAIYTENQSDLSQYNNRLERLSNFLPLMNEYCYIARDLHLRLFASYYIDELLEKDKASLAHLNKRLYLEHKNRGQKKASRETDTEDGRDRHEPDHHRRIETDDVPQKRFKSNEASDEPSNIQNQWGHYERPSPIVSTRKFNGSSHQSFLVPNGNHVPSSFLSDDSSEGKSVKNKIFEGKIRLSNSLTVNSVTLFSCSDPKLIIKCPVLWGQDLTMAVIGESDLDEVGNAFKRVRPDDPKSMIVIGGWVETSKKQDLEQLSGITDGLFLSQKVLEISYTSKTSRGYLLEEHSFHLNYEEEFGWLLGKFRSQIKQQSYTKLLFLFVSWEHCIRDEYEKIIPIPIKARTPQNSHTHLSITKPPIITSFPHEKANQRLSSTDNYTTNINSQIQNGRQRNGFKHPSNNNNHHYSLSNVDFLNDYQSLKEIINAQTLRQFFLPRYLVQKGYVQSLTPIDQDNLEPSNDFGYQNNYRVQPLPSTPVYDVHSFLHLHANNL